MAGDWIKMRGNLWDDPRVSALVDATDTSEAAVIGALYWLWASADQHTEDGVMPGLTLRQIDRKTGVPGFAAALCAIGWVVAEEGGIRIVKFEEHNGASAKRRSTDAQRKANVRSVSASDADNSRTQGGQIAPDCGAREREEKEKKEEKAGKASPRGSRLPADWSPSPEETAYCRTTRPDLIPDTVAADFRDYWTAKPGKDGLKLDWVATWRVWVRGQRAPKPGAFTPAGAVTTVPGRQGRDPELLRREHDLANRTAPSAAVAAHIAKLKGAVVPV